MLGESSFRYQRRACLAILVVLVLLAPAAVALQRPADPPRVLTADDVANGVPADGVGLGAGWRVAGAEPLTLEASTSEATSVVLRLRDAPVFGARGAVEGGALRFLVDGREAARWTAGGELSGRDVALGPGTHELRFLVEPSAGQARARLVLEGATPTTLPRVLDMPSEMAGCVLDAVRITVTWSLPLDDGSVEVLVGGEAAPVRASSALDRYARVTTLDVALPPAPEGRSSLDVAVVRHLPTGAVEVIVERVLWRVNELVLRAFPNGWVYDPQPIIGLDLVGCTLPPDARVRLEVDGKPVDGARFRFDRELAFLEEHSWRYDIRLGKRDIVLEGRFIEGLDVVEFDVHGGRVLFLATPYVAGLTNAKAPDELPPIVVHVPPFGIRGAWDVATPHSARLKAYYAPLALACTDEPRTCAPYGGDAPGFVPDGVGEARLEVTPEGKGTVPIPAAGQFAAASYYSRPEPGPLPASLGDLQLRERLAALGIP